MSLGCYPLGRGASLKLDAQPLSMTVAYEENLFICVVDQGKGLAIFQLNNQAGQLIRKISLGSELVIDQVIYCKRGDYIACIANRDGLAGVYLVTNWRDAQREAHIGQLDFGPALSLSNYPLDSGDKLNCIDCCGKSGNLAICMGDIILIYKQDQPRGDEDEDETSSRELIQIEEGDGDDSYQFTNKDMPTPSVRKLSSDSLQNSTGLTLRHLISLKLSIWGASIRMVENYLSITAEDHVQVLKLELLKSNFVQIHSEEDCITWNLNTKKLVKLPTLMHNSSSNLSSYHICHPCELLGPASEAIACRVKSSVFSEQLSQNQLEVVVLLCKQFDQELVDSCHMLGAQLEAIYLRQPEEVEWANLSNLQQQQADLLAKTKSSNNTTTTTNTTATSNTTATTTTTTNRRRSPGSAATCQNGRTINSATNRSLGRPTRLTPSVGSAELQPPLGPEVNGSGHQDGAEHQLEDHDTARLLKSTEYESLASVCCFVNTSTHCHIYDLHSRKKVTRLHSIIHPDLCLDLRPDLLNVMSLSPLGLQINSLASCDATIHYDWSSSGDLNLSFIALDKQRVLASRKYIILISCSHQASGCSVEWLAKPELAELNECISRTVDRCHSNSIRINLLTYLHAISYLALSDQLVDDLVAAAAATANDHDHGNENGCCLASDHVMDILRQVGIKLCKQLMQKKQTNIVTNQRIDNTIKHLLDISYCDLAQLMGPNSNSNNDNESHQVASSVDDASLVSLVAGANETSNATNGNLDNQLQVNQAAVKSSSSQSNESNDINDSNSYGDVGGVDVDDDAEPGGANNLDNELIKIYLKHAQFSDSLLDYLVDKSSDQLLWSRLIKLLFEHNPRLLIDCAQRVPSKLDQLNNNGQSCTQRHRVAAESSGSGEVTSHRLTVGQTRGLLALVDLLKLLVEFDSTGINRASVLFALALLYNALEDRPKCLAALDQIKPLNHLAITMSSNWELSNPIAKLVDERYPNLLRGPPGGGANSALSNGGGRAPDDDLDVHKKADQDDDDDPATASNLSDQLSDMATPRDNTDDEDEDDDDGDEDETDSDTSGELFESKLKLVADVPTEQLLELLELEDQNWASSDTNRKLLEASISLMESQFVLNRLKESSQ